MIRGLDPTFAKSRFQVGDEGSAVRVVFSKLHSKDGGLYRGGRRLDDVELVALQELIRSCFSRVVGKDKL